MFEKNFPLFKLLGFEVRIDYTWFFLAVLITWSLAAGFFPLRYPDLPSTTYLIMGLVGAAGLFLSIILHEMSHSLVARKHGIPMKGITLFIFGGVAEMGEEPPSPKAEFLMAIAGPIASIIISGTMFLTHHAGQTMDWPIPVMAVVSYLAWINLILAAFNLVPAFPLDGGRILRSFLWYTRNDLRGATRITSHIGGWFGMVLIILGALTFMTGNFVGGMWWCLIGMFIRSAARMSLRQVLIRKALEGESVRSFMQTDPVTVPPDITVQSLIDDFIYRDYYKLYPVVDNGHLIGCITTNRIKQFSRGEWAKCTVGEIAEKCSRNNSIAPDTDAMKAMAIMSQTGASRFLVVEGDRLVGILVLKDLLKFLSMHIELEGN
jgi:Zn-dependent protease/CBS domain-containing protein